MLPGGLVAQKGHYCLEWFGLRWWGPDDEPTKVSEGLHLAENVTLKTASKLYKEFDSKGIPVRIYDHRGDLVRENMDLVMARVPSER